MTEKKLLQELLNLREEERELVFKLANTNEKNQNSQEQILEQKRSEILSQKNYLLNVKDNSDSTQAYHLMIELLSAYIQYIKTSGPQYLSRNQGLIFRNQLFSKIIGELQSLSQADFAGISLPNLYFSEDRDDRIDKNMFNEFLMNELNELRKLKEINFIVLEEFVTSFAIRINNSFLEEGL